MKPLDIMNALRDVPDDLIDMCFDASVPQMHAQENVTDLFAACKPEASAAPLLKQRRTIRYPHVLTGIAVAACLLFAVGFSAVMLQSSRENLPVLQQPEDTAEPPFTELLQTETTAESATETEPAETTTEPRYIELELHEAERRTISWEENDQLLADARARYEENGGPALIDRQKYIRKYFSDDAEGDFNELEAKSYIYHMMLNSIDYFTNAEGEMTYGLPGNEVEIRFQTDDRTGMAYERESNQGVPTSDYFHNGAESMNYTVDLRTNQYTAVHTAGDLDFILRDNERCMLLTDGSGIANRRNDLTWLKLSGDSCLFPQNYAMSRLCDFSLWRIVEKAEKLGFPCVVITGTRDTANGRFFRMFVAVETGILLRYEEYFSDGAPENLIETTALTLDADMKVKQFDPADYPRRGMEPEQQAEDFQQKYQINEYGQTYGSSPMDALNLDDYPDLLAVSGDHYIEGYVYTKELFSDIASSPEKANQITEAQRNGTYLKKILNVYASDGRTIVDTFTENAPKITGWATESSEVSEE